MGREPKTLESNWGDLVELEMKEKDFLGEITADTLDGTESQRSVELKCFHLLRLLGEGGMGQVYEAHDSRLKRKIAVKVLKNRSAAGKLRFVNEARLQARVDHPHICKVYEAGEENGVAYIAMQLIDGQSLSQVILSMSLEQQLLLLANVASAIHEAHRAGLIHRDLKPGNIMVEGLGEQRVRPYILDFGIARGIEESGLTQTGAILGTPYYMSPEQALGLSELDARCDVYALGAILYTFLMGRPPYAGQTPTQILSHLQSESSPGFEDKEIPSELRIICEKAMAFDLSQRYHSARAFAEDLQRYLDDEPILAKPPTLSYKIKKLMIRQRILVITILSAVFILMSSLGFSSWRSLQKVEMVRELTESLERIKGLHRNVMMARPHDTKVSLGLIQEEISFLEQKKQDWGERLEGPVFEALGAAHYHLGDLTMARLYLEKAWERSQRTQKTAYYLGLTLAELYDREQQKETLRFALEKTDRNPRESVALLRDQALHYLEFCKGTNYIDAQMLEAQIAYISGDYQQALDILDVQEWQPWLYELDLLQGKIYRQLFRTSQGRELEQVTQYYQLAEKALNRAVASGRSDGRIYREIASLGRTKLSNLNIPDDEYQIIVNDGLQELKKALALDANDDEARWIALDLHVAVITRAIDRAEISSPSLEYALQQADVLTTEIQSPSLASRVLMYLHFRRAQLAINQKLDPASHLNLALEASEAVSEKDRDNDFYSTLGLIWMHRAKHVTQSLEDEAAAKEAFEISLRLEPDHFFTNNHFGMFYLWLAKRVTGEEQDQAYEQAAFYLMKASESNPDHYLTLYYLGRIHRFMGNRLYERGEDPRDAYEKALEYFGRGILLKTAELHFVLGRADIFLLLVEYDLANGRDVTTALANAYKSYQRAVELGPKVHLVYQNFSIIQYLDGLSRYYLGLDPREPLREALGNLELASKLAPGPVLDYLKVQAMILPMAYSLEHDIPFDGYSEIETILKRLTIGEKAESGANYLAGVYWLTKARYAMDGEAATLFQKAHKAFAQEENTIVNRVAHARLCVYEARASHGETRARALELGTSLVNEVLKEQPGNMQAMAIRSVLSLTQDPQDDAARLALRKVLNDNKYLAHEWGRY